jgi:hypothetical protein
VSRAGPLPHLPDFPLVMSVTDRPSRPELTEPPHAARRGGFAAWGRVFLVCALLVASGLIRTWQDRRLQYGLSQGRTAVVPLPTVPRELGPWLGIDTKLDPQIARITAADLIVTRRYTNRNTGVTVDVILLFGPPFAVSLHSPTVCYPSAGFQVAEEPSERVVEIDEPAGAAGSPGGKAPARLAVPLLAGLYAKGEGAQADLQEVYWTWWYDGHWTPYTQNKKLLDRVPSIIKVHTSRRAVRGEQRDANNPNEALLRLLLPEIERLLPSRSPRTS